MILTYFPALRSIDYLDACVQVFATPQKFTPYYWHNINTPNAPFVVFLSLTNLVGSEKYRRAQHLLHRRLCAVGASLHVDGCSRTETDSGTRTEEDFPRVRPVSIVEDGLFRLRNAQHIVDIGFEENKLLPHKTPCPGVIMCNFSQIYPDGSRHQLRGA